MSQPILIGNQKGIFNDLHDNGQAAYLVTLGKGPGVDPGFFSFFAGYTLKKHPR